MRFTNNEEAVSPVIGVILMVAITVILAAVIAVFVFGLAGDLESSAQKDVTLKTGTNADGLVTFQTFSGKDVEGIRLIAWTNGTAGQSGSDPGPFTVGKTNSTGWNKAISGSVSFTATFADGSKQVIATT